MQFRALAKETAVVSASYLAAFLVTYDIVTPLQDVFFPEFPSHASLLFLPHGVRVLSAWLFGWRSTITLVPGVFLAFFSVAGFGAFAPSRLIAILVAVTVPAATFQALRLIKWDLSPQLNKTPCWPCIMTAGVVISILSSLLTNYAFGSASTDYVAYLIGDIFGLFFLMLILMFIFRFLRSRQQ